MQCIESTTFSGACDELQPTPNYRTKTRYVSAHQLVSIELIESSLITMRERE